MQTDRFYTCFQQPDGSYVAKRSSTGLKVPGFFPELFDHLYLTELVHARVYIEKKQTKQ